MDWQDIPVAVDDWSIKVAAAAYDIRKHTSNVITTSHFGYYCNADGRVGFFAPYANTSDVVRVKTAMARAVGPSEGILSLSYQDLAHPDATWIKVAYSPTLHRAGELLNFFPGQYPGGIPNSPSPVAAMLTSGLIGAGLGYGGGRLIGAVMPEGYGKKLGRTGAILGSIAGMVPGAMWGATNTLTGRSFNNPELLDAPLGSDPIKTPAGINGANQPQGGHGTTQHNVLEDVRDAYEQAPYLQNVVPLRKRGEDESDRYTVAYEKFASTFGTLGVHNTTASDVNIDALGRTLWDSGASPGLAASAMSSVYAARQLPDPNARPGWATGQQLGQLAMNSAGDYATGLLVGAVLNKVVGTPYRAPVFGAGAATLGIIGAVVPKLFGG